MLPNLVSAAIAAAAGALICAANYTISKKVLIKSPDKYSFTIFAHQLLHIAFLAAVYFIVSRIKTIDVVYPLGGAVLGMTAPMFFFTKKLLSLNNKMKAAKAETEDDAHGREI